MNIRVPPRPYSTFSELLSKWGRNENSLRFAIISGALKPSMWLTGQLTGLAWQQDSLGRWTHHQPIDEMVMHQSGGAAPRLLYLQDPIQTGPFDCEFKLACDARDPEKSVPFDLWCMLDERVTLSDVVFKAIFTFKEIERYEEKFRHESFDAKQQTSKPEKPLGRTERHTLLTIIAVLCEEAKLDYKTASKTSDLIEHSAAKMGISIGATSIRDHLKKIPDALATRTR